MEERQLVAKVLNVYDGDNIDLEVDLSGEVYFGLDISVPVDRGVKIKKHFALAKLNAPEKSMTGGADAAAWLTEQLPRNLYVIIQPVRINKERWACHIWKKVPGEEQGTTKLIHINEEMVKVGHAKAAS